MFEEFFGSKLEEQPDEVLVGKLKGRFDELQQTGSSNGGNQGPANAALLLLLAS